MMKTGASCPPDVLDLLPWYPDDGLTSEERGVVEAHAATCPECRREILDGFRGAALPPDAPSPERVLARVFERIAAGEAAFPSAAPVTRPRVALRQAPAAAPPRFAAPRTASPFRARFAPSWAAAAGIALLVGGLATLGVVRLTRTAAPVYETATAPSLAPVDGARLDVILREDVSAAQVGAALHALGAEIVGGPSALGRYRISLPAGVDAADAASALRAEGTGIATFAEPLPAD